ncbi:hypothetical protein [Legionella cincinnatiensis]|uniref:Uncharacterized protein n=1 Tax=Legionella cincinnatiensis TaxID=28085 RepID=A0A378IJ99_9GAMM|nr:hypothetical protein [Legionella cincinnatiensis]KTC93289.1 hypothetical protein Lcin_0327 [Legionella cincinnatiensis]STX35010.1 Uncharacterised protein [Legionella cincinnatiensis]
MSKKPKEVARATAEKIAKDLLDTRREEPLTNQEVSTLLNKHIEDAYLDVTPADITSLYKALSVLLHPDKLDSRLSSYLKQEELDLTGEPFKILNRINQKYLLKNAAKNPKDGFSSFIEYFDHLMKPMEESLDRYYQPFRFLAKASYGILSIFIGAAVFIGIIGFFLSAIVLDIANGLIHFTLNSLTNNQYTKELNNYLDPHFEEYKALFLKNYRIQAVELLIAQQKEHEAEQIQTMSDDDLLTQIINAEVEVKLRELFQRINPFAPNKEALMMQIREQYTESLKNEINDNYRQLIKNRVSINDFTRLKLISVALYHAITKPLDEVEGNKLFSVILRPIQIVASPLILGATTLVGLVSAIGVGLVLTGVGVSFVAKAAALALLNTPLYALDLGQYIAKKIKGCVFGNEHSEFMNEGPRNLLMLEWYQDKSPTRTEKPPIHSGSLFANPKSGVPTKTEEQELPRRHSISC